MFDEQARKESDETLGLKNYNSEEMEIVAGVKAIRGCEGLSEEECLVVWDDMMRIVSKIDKG